MAGAGLTMGVPSSAMHRLWPVWFSCVFVLRQSSIVEQTDQPGPGKYLEKQMAAAGCDFGRTNPTRVGAAPGPGKRIPVRKSCLQLLLDSFGSIMGRQTTGKGRLSVRGRRKQQKVILTRREINRPTLDLFPEMFREFDRLFPDWPDRDLLGRESDCCSPKSSTTLRLFGTAFAELMETVAPSRSRYHSLAITDFQFKQRGSCAGLAKAHVSESVADVVP
jgi:hypothetical protein